MREYTDLQRKYISTLVRWIRHPLALDNEWHHAVRATRKVIYTGYHTNRIGGVDYMGATMTAHKLLKEQYPDYALRAFGNSIVAPNYPFMRGLFNSIRKCPSHSFEAVHLDPDAFERAMGKL